MPWLILTISGLFEAVWAVALSKSDGFTKLGPSLVFVAAMVVSMAGLAIAMRDLPLGTSYAVWVAIGSIATVTYAMSTGAESFTIMKLIFLLMIVAGVVGLKISS